MEITVTTSKLSEVMQTLAEKLSVRTIQEGKVRAFSLPKRIGQGRVEAHLLHDGLSLITINGTLVEAQRIIMQQLQDPPSIKDLARMVGINELKLKKGYKQLFHTTVYHHIRQERLNLARVLLAEGKWNVGEVAQRVGYVNKSHFALKFQEKFGMFPKQFQQSLLDKGL